MPQDQALATFRLSITRALADQLAVQLDELGLAPLAVDELDKVAKRAGIYLLYRGGHRVYVGKATSNLKGRLEQHRRKISGREEISLDEMSFKALYVDEDLDAAAPEKLLIRAYRAEGRARKKERVEGEDPDDQDGVPWNTNGFGNKDPGRRRDGSEIPANHFDAKCNANLEYELDLGQDEGTLGGFLEEAKKRLPYNLRFLKVHDSSAARDAYKRLVKLSSNSMTVTQFMTEVVGSLPLGWQATALPGYIILYNEVNELPSARGWWRSADGGAFTASTPAYDRPKVIKEEQADEPPAA